MNHLASRARGSKLSFERMSSYAQAEFLTGLRPRGDVHRDVAAERGHGYGRAERCFPGSDGERQCYVTIVEREAIVGCDVHLEVQVTRTATAGRRLTLPCESNQLPLGDARRNRYPHGVRAQLHRTVRLHLGALELQGAGRALKGLSESDVYAGVMIATTAAGCSSPGER